MVISHAVPASEERLACILCSSESNLHIVGITESVSNGMFVLIAKIPVLVTFPFIERNFYGCEDVVFAIFGYIAEFGKFTVFILLSKEYESCQEFSS